MKILLACATFGELAPLIEGNQSNSSEGLYKSIFPNVEILVSGIGTGATIFNLTRHLQDNQYDLVVNAGICGSYIKDIPLGSVVEIVEDCFADQLVETGNGIISWSEAGLTANNSFPYLNCKLNSSQISIPLNSKQVKAITSDTVHGNQQSIDQIKFIYNPDVESMEGAAVFYVCKHLDIMAVQVRAVSNYVGVRDKSQWEIQLAIKNLFEFLKQMMQSLSI